MLPLTHSTIITFVIIEVSACVVGLIAELGLFQLRKERYKLERSHLHDIVHVIPLNHKLILGRNELYTNLSELLKEGVMDKGDKRIACGTSVYFDSDDKGEYDKAIKRFIEIGGEVRYVGPLEKQPDESDKIWRVRERNIEKRRTLGIKIKHIPISPSSPRFLVVNQKYVSIEFPVPHHPLPLEEEQLKSVVAVSFENATIGALLQALFNVMWAEGSC
jgi:hypothetical protein